MGFHGVGYDISQLPKVLTHAQLGRMGTCAWYSPWDCYTDGDVQAMKTDLENAHVFVIDFANAANALYNDARARGAGSEIINGLGSSVADATNLVHMHTDLMNKFYAETGAGVAGLKGPRLSGLRSLGIAFLVLMEVAEYIGLALRWAGWAYMINYAVGALKDAAVAFQDTAKADQAKFQQRGEYYKTWVQAKQNGWEPPAPYDDSGSGGILDGGNMMMIGGIAILALLIFMKR